MFVGKRDAVTLDEVIAELREQADKKAVAGMHRVGINPRGTLGVQIPKLQNWRDASALIMRWLWIYGPPACEARILAAMVDDHAVDRRADGPVGPSL